MLTEAVQEVRPGAEVRVRIDRSARLPDAVDRGEIDLAVYVTEATAAAGTAALVRRPLRYGAAVEAVRALLAARETDRVA
ncbi:hypothetical protein ABT173_46740 [Streptomyces sp. NPDC001795]|uniref:hypothetical protein n=1 Tax=Streptomyces sp. NPDC001795 TaxID=3154525 RepID=UPI0033168FD6